jgi:hypothetical protein
MFLKRNAFDSSYTASGYTTPLVMPPFITTSQRRVGKGDAVTGSIGGLIRNQGSGIRDQRSEIRDQITIRAISYHTYQTYPTHQTHP